MRTFACAPWISAGLLAAGSVCAQPAAATARPGAINAAVATHTAKVEKANGGLTKLSLLPKGPGTAELKLHDASGKEVPSTVAANGVIEAIVDPSGGYILSTKETKRQPLLAEGIQFPGRYITAIASGTPNLGGLFLRPSRVPLMWDDAAKAYVTQLVVGYEFQNGVETKLGAPKTVTFFAEGSNASIQLDTVLIDFSGGPGYKRVTLSTRESSGETFFTARAGPADELKSSVTVQREPGTLKLTLPSREIGAYGVGSGTLSVSLLAKDGLPMETAEPLAIQLSSRRLRLPAMVTLPKNASVAEVNFRSAGFGMDAITAHAGALTATQELRLIFPAAAVIAAVAGGLLGGFTRYLRNKRGQRKNSPLLVRRLLEGALVGVIFVGAAWAGLVTVNLSTGILGTPFGAFILAALSGYVGCLVLDRVTKRTFKTLDADS
ncbi:MAG: hypothetical protein ABIZ81_00045 [Opitutaceae bacterium]